MAYDLYALYTCEQIAEQDLQFVERSYHLPIPCDTWYVIKALHSRIPDAITSRSMFWYVEDDTYHYAYIPATSANAALAAAKYELGSKQYQYVNWIVEPIARAKYLKQWSRNIVRDKRLALASNPARRLTALPN
jgi:hypothetical protein